MPNEEACLARAEERARSAYSEPLRRYHDQRHLDDCLTQLDGVADLDAADRQLLRWAILWHDAIYDPTRSDNEEQSARLAAAELEKCGVDAARVGEVAGLILLTKGHQVGEGDRLGGLLVSIDLSILGAEPERYRSYVSDVRQEYRHVADDAWRAGRAAVLNRLLSAAPIYPDRQFRDRLETSARSNMTAELRDLTED